MNRYLTTLVPHPGGRSRKSTSPDSADQGDGEYEEEYSCCPPPLAMVFISLLVVRLSHNKSIESLLVEHNERDKDFTKIPQLI